MKQIAESLTQLQASKEVVCHDKWAVISVTGTLDTEVITIQASPDGGANWFVHRSDDGSGTPGNATFDATDVSSGIFTRVFVAAGQRLRAILSNNGGTIDSINVYAEGVGTSVVEKSVQGVPA